MSKISHAKLAVFSFGRMNPVTTGHQLMVTEGQTIAEKMGADYFLFPSRTEDKPNTVPEKSRNPLSFTTKLAFLHEVFPGVNIIDEPDIKSPQQVTTWLASQGYTDVSFVVGEDRKEEFENRWLIYTPEYFYQAQVCSVGYRNEYGTGVEATSGTAAREAALNADIDAFHKATGWGIYLTLRLFSAVREGMGLKNGESRGEVKQSV